MDNKVTAQDERELMNVNDDSVDVVPILGTDKNFKIGYLKPYCTERITRKLLESDELMIKSEQETAKLVRKKSKIAAQISAYILLNNFFKIKFFHAILWRWYYYIKEYTYYQLVPVIMMAKKKMGLEEYAIFIGLAATMMETQIALTTKQMKQFRAELLSAQEAVSEKDIRGQSNP